MNVQKYCKLRTCQSILIYKYEMSFHDSKEAGSLLEVLPEGRMNERYFS